MVDTLGLGSSARKRVQVRLLFSVPRKGEYMNEEKKKEPTDNYVSRALVVLLHLAEDTDNYAIERHNAAVALLDYSLKCN